MTPWERTVEAYLADPEKRARAFRIAYWISFAFTAFGFAVILWELRREGIL